MSWYDAVVSEETNQETTPMPDLQIPKTEPDLEERLILLESLLESPEVRKALQKKIPSWNTTQIVNIRKFLSTQTVNIHKFLRIYTTSKYQNPNNCTI